MGQARNDNSRTRGAAVADMHSGKKNLLLLAAHIGVDFGAERNFGNLRGVPGHDEILVTILKVLDQLYDRTRKWVASQIDSTQ